MMKSNGSMLSETRRGAIQVALLRWYRAHQRDLPWRRTSDPYAVWVSEIMLQQTQVETVKPYYRRFLRRFPTVRALARAPLDAVIKAWEGLGYYSRCRNLHRAAREVVERFGGRLPQSAEELLTLPGIGPYTAGAISSIAFGRDEAVLDGNVIRVYARVLRVRQPVDAGPTKRRLWAIARAMVPRRRASFFNQALMDLGAMVCVPRNPRCPACPLRTHCLAQEAGVQNALPRKRPRKTLPHHDIAAGIVWRGRRFLIDQRRSDALLGGLWELPGGKRQAGESLEECLAREVREEVGIEIADPQPFVAVEHAYSHFRITLHVFHCRHASGRARAIHCTAVKWITPEEIAQFAFPKANRKVFDALTRKQGRRTTARRAQQRRAFVPHPALQVTIPSSAPPPSGAAGRSDATHR